MFHITLVGIQVKVCSSGTQSDPRGENANQESREQNTDKGIAAFIRWGFWYRPSIITANRLGSSLIEQVLASRLEKLISPPITRMRILFQANNLGCK